jgi:hypothetical protein
LKKKVADHRNIVVKTDRLIAGHAGRPRQYNGFRCRNSVDAHIQKTADAKAQYKRDRFQSPIPIFIYYFRGKQRKTIQKALFFSREIEVSIPLLSKPIPARDLTEVAGRVKMYFKKLQGVFMQEL